MKKIDLAGEGPDGAGREPQDPVDSDETYAFRLKLGVKDTNPKDAVGAKKAPLSTVSAPVMLEVGLAMLEGARKYGRHNYRVAGIRASVYYDAVMRHMMAWWEGEDVDPDSGLSHVTKAIASLMVLRDAMINAKWTDDRPPWIAHGWLAALNDKAAEIIEKYPGPKKPSHGGRQMKGFDTALNVRLKVDMLWDKGYRVAFRYLTRSPNDWRQLRRDEAQALSDKGFLIGCYFQHKMDDPAYILDFDRAALNATHAVKRAKELSIPKGSGIYYAIDCDVVPTPVYRAALVRHFEVVKRIVNEAGYRLGAYGDDDVGHLLVATGIVEPKMTIRACARGWSQTDLHKDWGAYQSLPIYVDRGGFQVDPLEITATPEEMGLWSYRVEEKQEGGGILEAILNFLRSIFSG